MGQVFPLPQKIPTPTLEQRAYLMVNGILVESVPGQPYQTVKLPTEYEMRENTKIYNAPEWFILRKGTDMACAKISGNWERAQNLNLHLQVYRPEQQVELFDRDPKLEAGGFSHFRSGSRNIGRDNDSLRKPPYCNVLAEEAVEGTEKEKV